MFVAALCWRKRIEVIVLSLKWTFSSLNSSLGVYDSRISKIDRKAKSSFITYYYIVAEVQEHWRNGQGSYQGSGFHGQDWWFFKGEKIIVERAWYCFHLLFDVKKIEYNVILYEEICYFKAFIRKLKGNEWLRQSINKQIHEWMNKREVKFELIKAENTTLFFILLLFACRSLFLIRCFPFLSFACLLFSFLFVCMFPFSFLLLFCVLIIKYHTFKKSLFQS